MSGSVFCIHTPPYPPRVRAWSTPRGRGMCSMRNTHARKRALYMWSVEIILKDDPDQNLPGQEAP